MSIRAVYTKGFDWCFIVEGWTGQINMGGSLWLIRNPILTSRLHLTCLRTVKGVAPNYLPPVRRIRQAATFLAVERTRDYCVSLDGSDQDGLGKSGAVHINWNEISAVWRTHRDIERPYAGHQSGKSEECRLHGGSGEKVDGYWNKGGQANDYCCDSGYWDEQLKADTAKIEPFYISMKSPNINARTAIMSWKHSMKWRHGKQILNRRPRWGLIVPDGRHKWYHVRWSGPSHLILFWEWVERSAKKKKYRKQQLIQGQLGSSHPIRSIAIFQGRERLWRLPTALGNLMYCLHFPRPYFNLPFSWVLVYLVGYRVFGDHRRLRLWDPGLRARH